MKEEWRIIKGYPNYKISNYGNVLSINYRMKKGISKLLSLQNDLEGYKMVFLYNKNVKKVFRTHVLVAKNFIPEIKGKNTVNHIDGNKSNNYVENLEWVTIKENLKHAIETGLRRKSENKNKTKVIDLSTNIIYESIMEVSRTFNISYSTLTKMLNNIIKNNTDFRVL